MHEIHNSSTKKNKEWQEMLPLVVLKAEEILYSKASSEVFFLLLYYPSLLHILSCSSQICYILLHIFNL